MGSSMGRISRAAREIRLCLGGVVNQGAPRASGLLRRWWRPALLSAVPPVRYKFNSAGAPEGDLDRRTAATEPAVFVRPAGDGFGVRLTSTSGLTGRAAAQ